MFRLLAPAAVQVPASDPELVWVKALEPVTARDHPDAESVADSASELESALPRQDGAAVLAQAQAREIQVCPTTSLRKRMPSSPLYQV